VPRRADGNTHRAGVIGALRDSGYTLAFG